MTSAYSPGGALTSVGLEPVQLVRSVPVKRRRRTCWRSLCNR